jgi:hypothetical protein
MKKCILIVMSVVILVVVSSFMVFAGEKDSDCSPAGTWYGGSSFPDHAGFKYQYTFIPVEADRFLLTAEGAYNPDSLGAAVATTFTGELVKKADGSFEIRLIALTTTDPTHPPEELPMIVAGKADVQFDGCDKMIITYDWAGFYKWDSVPFVDYPVAWMIKPDKPTVETLNRMRMGTELPEAPSEP